MADTLLTAAQEALETLEHHQRDIWPFGEMPVVAALREAIANHGPNRVVIEMEDGIESTHEEIRAIRAENPDGVCIIIRDWMGDVEWDYVEQLGAVSGDDWDELLMRDEEDHRARQEEHDLHYQGMGG